MRKLRLLLIQPCITSDNPNAILTEPLGIASLAAFLKNVDVEILDLFALGCDQVKKVGNLYRRGLSDPEEIIKHIKRFDPDIVGLTCNFTAFIGDAIEVAKIIKKNFKNILIVFGGAHPTMDAYNLLSKVNEIDVVVRGEGELTIKELLENYSNNHNISKFHKIKGITYREKNIIKSNSKRELIPDINILPIPDRSKLNMKIYLKLNRESLPFTKQEPVATIMTSRGCPFNCIFCSTKMVWERKYRPRDPQKVIEEIEMLIRDYGVKEIAINDDQFLLDKKRVEKICDLILSKKLGITLSIPSGASIWLADRTLLEKMKRAGFYRLCFPIETGNPNTMKFIRKPIDLEQAKSTIEMANRLGFWTQGNFIIGFPYETEEEIRSTIRYAYNSGLDYANFFIAKPYAGSEMYDIFIKENLFKEISRGSDIKSASYDTTTMKAEDLQQIRNNATKGFLFHKILFYITPWNFVRYMFPRLSSIKDIKYTAKITYNILKLTIKGVV